MKNYLEQAAARKKVKKTFLAECKGKLCFAFDFGEYATKIAVAKVTKDKVEIKNLIVVENDENHTRIDDSNIKEWRAKLSRVLAQHSLNTYGQIGLCSIGSRGYISRQLEIPYVKDEDREGLVAHEMSQILSLDVDSYLFQHKVKDIYESNGVQMCTVWAAAVSKKTCDNYYELLESLKLNPLVMDININGLERLFAADRGLEAQVQDKTVAVVDYGIRSTEVSMFEGGIYRQGSNINLGEGRLVTAAKNVLGVQISNIHNGNKLVVSPQVIYDILKQAQTSDPARMFMTVVEDWISEINSAIKRYNINHPGKEVEALLLYGGSLQFPWLKAYLERYLDVPTTVVTALDCAAISGKTELTSNTIPQFLNAIGLFYIQ